MINQSDYQKYLNLIKEKPLEAYKAISALYFKDQEGNPFQLTDTQARIFQLIYEPQYKRVAVKTPTQYGKTDTASQGILTVLGARKEKIAILAPKEEQAGIIMNNIIGHIFDHPHLQKLLELDETVTLERLKKERSKKRLTFSNGSEIYILTANVRTIKEEGKSIMGFGATIVLVDESSLIPDKVYSKILRMVGGHKTGKIIKLGNPFYRNHFYRSFQNPRFTVVDIDYHTAIKEGRFTQDYIDETREEMDDDDFKIFYETQFPDRTTENSLITETWYDEASKLKYEPKEGDRRQAGLDVARYGTDSSVYKFRIGKKVVKTKIWKGLSTMQLVNAVINEMKEDEPDILAIDAIGIGAGVVDRFEELGYENVIAVVAGGKPDNTEKEEDKDRFINMRACVYWYLRTAFQKGLISLEYDKKEAEELLETNYYFVSDNKKKIESKEEIKKRIGRSPDRADALALAFTPFVLNKVEFDII